MKPRLDPLKEQSFMMVGFGICFLLCFLQTITAFSPAWLTATMGWFAAFIGELEKYSATKFANRVISETNRRNGHED